jgi:CDGSH-type Zn-finger protein
MAAALVAVSTRFQRMVIRPLSTALVALTSNGTPQPDRHVSFRRGTSADLAAAGARIRGLAERITKLLAMPGIPSQTREAAAGLQSLAWELAPAEEAASFVTTLEQLALSLPQSIVALPDGPLLATNVRNLRNWLGEPLTQLPVLALCRCGRSALKPQCDGNCAENGFSDAKDPKRIPDKLDKYAGPQLAVSDNRGTCAHSGFCSDRLPGVFHSGGDPFVTASGSRMDEVIRAVRACPSGALGAALTGVAQELTDTTCEPAIEVSRNGPYRITGSVPLLDVDDNPLARNQGASFEHYSLCRCGHSRNKPFCSGMHWYVDFVDPPLSAQPSLFEWAGGLPTLRRLTSIFYERYVPEDPLLAPHFAGIGPDHAESVALWFAEVFGGPRSYSEHHGGAARMASQHAAEVSARRNVPGG